MIKNQFDNIDADEGTKILFRSQMKYDEKSILFEKWYWDGIFGKSIIFLAEEIDNMMDEELKKYISKSDIIEKKESITISRTEKFIFINFDFKDEDSRENQ